MKGSLRIGVATGLCMKPGMCLLVMVYLQFLGVSGLAQDTLPLVAVHDSEWTRNLDSTNAPAVAPTPSGPGTTGRQWWSTNWSYFVLPDSVKEALRADGTAFAVVSDQDIAANRLLTNGVPRYPIVISLGSEAIADEQIAALTNYVAAGGFLLMGSSSFTRHTNGVSRGDFAFAAELGLSMSVSGLTNWGFMTNFTKVLEHPIVSHYPAGALLQRMPLSAEEINWGVSPLHVFRRGHLGWKVQATGATVLGMCDGTWPYLAVKPFGKGCFIYHAAFQPLIGHGGFAPSMYAYVVFRRSIEWAFQNSGMPVIKVSPWPYEYNAASILRHDLENYTNLIAKIEQSALFEYTNGAKGDYYFCTGTIREDASPAYDTNAIIASLRRAATNYGATIAPHNGGLQNPRNPLLVRGDYDYWHWGPDEALDVTPTNYASGKDYALVSISNSFIDVEQWLAGLPPTHRCWVSCYFNATREDSLEIQESLGVRISGEQKLTVFPHWTLSTRVPGKRYSFQSQPVSDWFIISQGIGQVAQSMEPWRPPHNHNAATLRAAVDFYYKLGGLINIYSHTLSTGEGPAGQLLPDYIRYVANTNLHPRVWWANAIGLYDWALKRSNAVLTGTGSSNGVEGVANLKISGVDDNSTAVEVLVPGAGIISAVQVWTNGIAASENEFRLVDRTVKVRVAVGMTNVQVRYSLMPKASADSYISLSGRTLTVPAPGVLTNDEAGLGSTLQASLVSGPTNGSIVLNPDGSFAYTPAAVFSGSDTFTYEAHDGLTNSGPAAVTIRMYETGLWFADDFSRPSEPGALTPWISESGTWTTSQSQLYGGPNPLQTYGTLNLTNTFQDCAIQARIAFPAGAFGGGIGFRLNPVTGSRYSAWVYPENSQGGSKLLKLVKFQDWSTFAYTNLLSNPMAQVTLPSVGTNWHTVKLAAHTNRLAVYYDGVQVLKVEDVEPGPFLEGGAALGMWTANLGYVMSIDDVVISPLAADEVFTVGGDRKSVIPAPGVLTNDTAVYTASLTAQLVTGPTNGTILLNTNGGFEYTPQAGYRGPDGFSYQVSDGGTALGIARADLQVVSGSSDPVLPPQTNRVAPELVLVTVTNTATDADLPNDLLSYQLISPPVGAQIDTNGIITWLPGESQGPGIYMFTTVVTDSSVPQNSATNSFQLEILEVNSPPMLPGASETTIDELVIWYGTNSASDADLPANALTYELLGGPGGAQVTSSGVVTWTPSETDGPGTNVFTLKVTDDGTPPLSATNAFTVIVREINSPPTLPIISDMIIDELALLQVTNGATDADYPANALSYQLLSGPTNAMISPAGVISWLPGEAQGPGTNLFRTRVQDNGQPALAATNTFVVVTREVNSAPVLPAQADRVIQPGQLLSVTNTGSDPDIPANTLSYQLEVAPSNALITTTGIIQWTPAPADSGTTNLFVTIVSDSGTPSLKITNTFAVIVRSSPPVIVLESTALVAEGCAPTNNSVDPGEMVSVAFSLQNTAPGGTINLKATLLETNGVSSVSGPEFYGVLEGTGPPVSRIFSFIANGVCGSNVQAVLQLEDAGSPVGVVTATFNLGTSAITLTQAFDLVTAPALPGDWTTVASGSQSNWITRSDISDTALNSAFVPGIGDVGLSRLVSPVFSMPAREARLSFRHRYQLESGSGSVAYDGGVLEIRIGTNEWSDVVSVGGSFVSGGYNRTIHANFGNPLAGRSAWSGNSGGFVTTLLNLPASAVNQNVQLSWVCGTDDGVSTLGWFVDSIQVSGIGCCVSPPAPELRLFSMMEGTAILTWETVQGVSYRLQFRESIGQENWLDHAPDVLGNGTWVFVTNSVTSMQRFYRLIVLP